MNFHLVIEALTHITSILQRERERCWTSERLSGIAKVPQLISDWARMGAHVHLTHELESLAAKPTTAPLCFYCYKAMFDTLLSKNPLLRDFLNFPLIIFVTARNHSWYILFFNEAWRDFCSICYLPRLLRSTLPIRLLQHHSVMKSGCSQQVASLSLSTEALFYI